LQMLQMQLEGLLICADYGQPLAMSPEAIAGATAPVTLAGLLAQQNALSANLELVEVQKRQRFALVDLYKALGGGWSDQRP
ncbi:MAG TPA: trimethylamine methyltransferase family protein, partial [Flavobacteriales bacterium]|nr:trimethylamine methyltransferase family protein [Flavobacteriales bacterium]